MSIPQLDSCCCGCTLKTGSKIIGWLTLVGSIIMLITMGTGLAALYYIEGHPDVKTPEANEIREHLPALKAVAMFVIALYVMSFVLAFILLMGVYQNKAKYVFFWVVVTLTVTIIQAVLSVVQMLTVFNGESVGSIIGFLIELYFILVVYSFYREIQNTSTNYA